MKIREAKGTRAAQLAAKCAVPLGDPKPPLLF